MYKIILNPFAGKGKAFKYIRQIESLFEEYKVSYDMVITNSPKQAIEFAYNAIENDFIDIVAAGGDGTVNEVVNGILASNKSNEVNMGILALGGGNDFVKTLNYPKNLEDQVQKFVSPDVKKIDVGKIEDNYFINTLGIGFDAKVAKSYSKNLVLNGSAGYYKAVMKELVKLQPYFLDVKLDDVEFADEILLISVGNGRFCGGKFQLTPDAELDDGFFDICVVDNISRFTIIKVLPRATSGEHVDHPKAHLYRTKRIVVSAYEDLPVYFDGELPKLKNAKELEITLEPSKINLII
ncbi:MAG: diacylglycerol kinase family lipid kinase [Candidatus Cloacimonetes bacterium]|nr:diacylglycerol kinase family lipid kinase [Candidatus Cloacimonadota bacterium]MBS3767813.1 diacylglycerol kinase family lipid kinase [Candidatus Cloacimonadota bacterium]